MLARDLVQGELLLLDGVLHPKLLDAYVLGLPQALTLIERERRGRVHAEDYARLRTQVIHDALRADRLRRGPCARVELSFGRRQCHYLLPLGPELDDVVAVVDAAS